MSSQAKSKEAKFPFDLDLSTLDTGSITNILNDIEQHLPLMESEGDLTQLLEVKNFFEEELKISRRLHRAPPYQPIYWLKRPIEYGVLPSGLGLSC